MGTRKNMLKRSAPNSATKKNFNELTTMLIKSKKSGGEDLRRLRRLSRMLRKISNSSKESQIARPNSPN